MHLAHRIALDPNNKQRSYFRQAAGNARYAYNTALAQVKAQLDENARCFPPTSYTSMTRPRIPTGYDMRKRFIADIDAKHPFMRAATKHAYERAILNLGDAIRRWLKGKSGFPHFKKKGKAPDAFSIGQTKVDGKRIWVPRLGWVRMREPLRFNGRIIRATISRTEQRWFVSISVKLNDLSHLPPADNQGAVGMDAGITTFMTLSNGEKIQPPRPLRSSLRKLKRLSKELHRRAEGSKNRQKTRMKLARLHARIANIRRNFQHQLSTAITRRFDSVAIENLAIPNMMRNRNLALSIADAGWGRFFGMLAYKAKLRGAEVVRIDRWEPTTKTCSTCGKRAASIPLNVRAWACAQCGTEHDRDVNAAKNIQAAAKSAEAINACGDDANRLSMKQEPNSESVGLGD